MKRISKFIVIGLAVLSLNSCTLLGIGIASAVGVAAGLQGGGSSSSGGCASWDYSQGVRRCVSWY